MRKFLIVGCGGSGGATVRLLMDQLQAELRARFGVATLPAAWQFVHIDVPVDPDAGPSPLSNITRMGGTYVSFSHPSNTYAATSLNVESTIASRAGGNYAPLLGWAPRDRSAANAVPVTSGAGQYRAIGRMLTLARLGQLQDALARALQRTAAPDAWGDLPSHERGSDVVIPVVVGSMAGGSGASMFLDVTRTLGTLGLNAGNIGALVYTADVFGELPEPARANVEGNAMGAVGEIIAAISRLAEDDDIRMMKAMGLQAASPGTPPFGRVVPIGRRIGGGTGALFGDGSAQGVYRGIARALCGIMSSEEASQQYLDYILGNPTPLETQAEVFGWRISNTDLPLGSLGFSSISLGRDRYMDYSAQRLARSCVDHLVAGHESRTSQMPSTQQLAQLMDNQWTGSLRAMGFPQPGTATPAWFQSVAYPQEQWQASAREVTSGLTAAMAQVGRAQAAAWLATARNRVATLHPQVMDGITGAAYVWAEGWAAALETSTKQEFARVTATFGLPYARELMERVRRLCDSLISDMAAAGRAASGSDPLALDTATQQQAAALGKQPVDADHALGQMLARVLQTGVESRLRLEAAKIGAEVLRSYSSDVLAALTTAANDELRGLEAERAVEQGGAGLAQLHSVRYSDWPGGEEPPAPRWEHAQNEILLTTAAEFPSQFVADVGSSAGTPTFTEGLAQIRSEVLSGRWESTGAKVDEDIVVQRSHWRAPVLNHSGIDGQPTPQAKPSYALRVSCADVLDRSRRRLESPGDAFARYATQGIRDFLDDPSVPEVERTERQQRFAAEFVKAMKLALPLTGIDGAMVQRVHGVAGVTYTYSFSDIPIAPEHPVSDLIRQQLRGNPDLDSATHDNFDRVLKRDAQVRNISMFGTYGKYTPLAFSSLLDPIKKRWASSSTQFQRQLWLWKRTRPLTGALAMHEQDAVRVIAGWFIGRHLGLVRQDGSVQVSTPRGWLTFGPMLESPEVGARGLLDILAAVLQSHVWAVIRCSGDPELTDLRPYAAVRRLADDSETNQSTFLEDYSGTRLLEQAFFGQTLTMPDPNSRGEVALQSDGLSPVLAGDGTATTGSKAPGATPWAAPTQPTEPTRGPAEPKERAERLLAWIESMRTHFTTKAFVTRDSAGDYVLDIPSVQALGTAPLHAEIGPLVMKALDLLEQMVPAALAAGDNESHEQGKPEEDFFV